MANENEVVITYNDNEIIQFDVTIDALKQLAEESKGVTVSSVDDKEGLVRVHERRMILKNERVKIEKVGKSMRDRANKFTKAVSARQAELISIIEPEEIRLHEEEDLIERLKESIRIEEERQETQRIQDRINQLAKFGRAIDFYEAKIMTDEAFEALLTEATIEFNEEQIRIAEEKIEAERQRLLEQERIAQERAELDRQRQENERKQAELQAEQERIRKDQEAKEAELQRERNRIADEQKIEQEKLRKEREAIDAERNAMALAERRKEEERRQAEEIKAAEERARVAEQERIHREEQLRLEKIREAEIEAKRQEELRPDKEKILAFADGLSAIAYPELKSEVGDMIIDECRAHITMLVNQLKQRIEIM